MDPAHPTHIYAGGELGIIRSLDDGATWDWWTDNLPNTFVRRLVIDNDKRLMRAVTYGRGLWERPLDALTAPDTELYLRDNALDLGRPPTPEGPNPFEAGKSEKVFSGADLKVNASGATEVTSTVDYTSLSGIDYIGFHDLPDRKLQHGKDTQIYLQVNNRGPSPAQNVQARLFWANKEGGSFPDLPASFWTPFPTGDPADTSKWHPIGPAQTVAELRPVEPVILTFSWPAEKVDDTVGVLAAITSTGNPIGDPGVSVATIAKSNKQVLLKELSVESPGSSIVGMVLLALALVVVTVVVIEET
jgi:hypothetical protein